MAKQKSMHITDLKQLESITFSGRLLADLRGVTARAIERAADPDDENYIGIKRIEKGKYEARHSLFVMLNDLVRQLEESKGGSAKDAKERKYNADAEKSEYELALLKKQMMKVDDSISVFEKFVISIMRKKSSFVDDFTPKILLAKTEKEIREQTQKQLDDLFNELSSITNITGSLGTIQNENDSVVLPVKTKRTASVKQVGRK